MDNVIPFGREQLYATLAAPPTPPTEEGSEPGVTIKLTPEQISMYYAIGVIGSFLLDNRDNIAYFAAVVAEKAPTEDNPGGLNYQVISSAINMEGLAMAAKILDISLNNQPSRNLTNG